MYYLDFALKTKIFSKNSKYNYFEIRLLNNKKVFYVLGFFDFVNNFIFFNFQKFFYFFFIFNIKYKKFFFTFLTLDLLFFIVFIFNLYLSKLKNKVYMIDKNYIFFFKRINKLIKKLFLKKIEREIKGFSWGKILLKQSKIINKIENEGSILF